MTPLLTWIDVATILRLDKGENDNAERMRKRRVLRIMREAGGTDVGQSELRVSEENLTNWIRINQPGLLPAPPPIEGDFKRHTIPLAVAEGGIYVASKSKHGPICTTCGRVVGSDDVSKRCKGVGK